MNAPQPKPSFSAADYLTWERTQELRHEYLDGEVFAMVGARDAHVTVALNVASLLREHLRGGPCRVFIADMKLRIDGANAFTYPDVFVTCDARDRGPEADLYKSHALLVIEVLSNSTAAYDRGAKFALYRQLPALAEYTLIDPERRSVEVFRRNAEGLWVLHPFGPEGEVEFAAVDWRADIGRVFEDVVIAQPETPRPASGGN